MSDNLSPENRRKTMQAVKGKGTRLEKRLWALLAGLGLKGWKKNAVDVIGKPDVAFVNQRLAIFIDGCFWHGCPYCNRKLPETNRDYWEKKIQRNIELARKYDERLKQQGWAVIRIWEHEMSDIEAVKYKILQLLSKGVNSMNSAQFEKVKQETCQILQDWLTSCTRHGKISRNTIAIGIVVFDHLRRSCPLLREQVISQGGEISGARSGLGKVLGQYGIPTSYLKEVTTRQGHQDGQRLLDALQWGNNLAGMPADKRDDLLMECIQDLKQFVDAWLTRQVLKFDVDRRQAPTTWVNVIVETAQGHSGGVVEQHLVGAKLTRRFKNLSIPNHPAHAGDRQTERAGDFEIAQMVYHVTSAPSRNVLQKCASNIRLGLLPVLLVPRNQENRARILAQDEGVDNELTIISIEDFIALNIIELAAEENKDFFTILKEIVEIYNRRLSEVETDLSLQIEVR